MPRTVQASHIAEMIQNGQMTPQELVTIDLGPSHQSMTDNPLIEGSYCCGMKHYEVTDSALIKTSPVCCCFGSRRDHYDLEQVKDIRERDCCGYLCSRADMTLRNGESVRIKCVDVAKFVETIRPRMGRRT